MIQEHRKHRVASSAFALIFVCGLVPAMACIAEPARIERRPVLMGTRARILVEGSTREEALEVSSRIEELLGESESSLSTWSTASEIAVLNRTVVGENLRLSALVSGELEQALQCAAMTDGAFDPTIGVLVAAWDLRGPVGRRPSQEEIRVARGRVGYRGLHAEGEVWQRSFDLIIDEGGFGKGAALDRVDAWLRRRSSVSRALIDLGGQLLLFDGIQEQQTDRDWTVEVADPDDREAIVVELDLGGGSVATSANTVRAVRPATEVPGHLLDPRTGEPATDFGSLTVWARSALWADCLATGLFVAGPEKALVYAAETTDVEVLVLERSGNKLRARISDGLTGRIRVLADHVTAPEAKLASKKKETTALRVRAENTEETTGGSL